MVFAAHVDGSQPHWWTVGQSTWALLRLHPQVPAVHRVLGYGDIGSSNKFLQGFPNGMT